MALSSLMENSTHINGKTEYLESPFVTAGNRVYMVGHQDGSFPELGWHIKGEMGGIWNHPIKLMDGFDIELKWNDESYLLNKADTFVNYPFANTHQFVVPSKNISVNRWQFVPDDLEGLLVQVELTNTGSTATTFDLDFTGHSDLRPTWLGERTHMNDAQDEAVFEEAIQGWIAKDKDNPWFVCYASDTAPAQKSEVKNTYSGLGASNQLSYAMEIEPNETKTINFIVAGSYTSKENTITTFNTIKSDWLHLLSDKKERYQQLAQQSKLTIPDKKMQQTFEWLKYNCDWLVRTVPEIGTGITAGIPDYPWWFGVDSEYALQGYMAIGQTDAVYSTIALLDSVSTSVNSNGKIIHEMSTNGAVFNKGNINETPQFASLIWSIYQWNGDLSFLEKYFPTIEKGLLWLMKENDLDGNGFPEGFGMMEIHGLDSEMIDVAAYSQRAFADAALMAKELGKDSLALQYQNIADELKNKINTEFWSENFNSYADFIGTDAQALHLIEDAIVRADTLNKPWAVEELEATKEFVKKNPSSKPRPFVMHHNWVVNTPMEMGIADSTKAIKALKTAEQFVNPFGVFVTGIDRDQSAGSDDGSFKGSKIFSYTGAVMTLPTGVQARAENNYGRPNEALNYLERMTRTFSYAFPGSMYEVSPDYGMITQAWNIYSFAYPIVHQFFGIQPNAAQKEVVISPLMPDAWDDCALQNVKIGDGANEISMFYTKKEGKTTIKIEQSNAEWKIKLKIPKSQLNQLQILEGTLSASGNEAWIESDKMKVEVSY
ncbi:glycogen debranching protein [Allomuricauda sp. CAU 1633]|uniref:alpha-L-rhamnosidase-related protein n=1 Tax=Allomuricauda sp. CAU 1633 TaxID=2816036 RepID=UPI001F5E2608|nr:glycogen debranching protein [Muricauda sp. CAU 1633]